MKVIGNYSLEALVGEEADKTTLPNAIVNIIQLSEGNEEIREQMDEMRKWFSGLDGGEPILMKAFNQAQEICRSYIIEHHLLPRFTYTKDDFLNTNEPYEYVFSYLINADRFEHERQIEAMADEAKAAKFAGFKKKYKLFCEKQRMVCAEDAGESSHPTHFPNQPMELEAGTWICDAEGVRSIGFGFSDVACCHPIMPVERLVNIDTGEEKIKIAFFKFKRWREITVPKETVAVASKITHLAPSIRSRSCRAISLDGGSESVESYKSTYTAVPRLIIISTKARARALSLLLWLKNTYPARRAEERFDSLIMKRYDSCEGIEYSRRILSWENAVNSFMFKSFHNLYNFHHNIIDKWRLHQLLILIGRELNP